MVVDASSLADGIFGMGLGTDRVVAGGEFIDPHWGGIRGTIFISSLVWILCLVGDRALSSLG